MENLNIQNIQKKKNTYNEANKVKILISININYLIIKIFKFFGYLSFVKKLFVIRLFFSHLNVCEK